MANDFKRVSFMNFFYLKDGCESMTFKNLPELLSHFRHLHGNQKKVCTCGAHGNNCKIIF